MSRKRKELTSEYRRVATPMPGLDIDGLLETMPRCAVCDVGLVQTDQCYRVERDRRVYAHVTCVDQSLHYNQALLLARWMHVHYTPGLTQAFEWDSPAEKRMVVQWASCALQAMKDLGEVAGINVEHLVHGTDDPERPNEKPPSITPLWMGGKKEKR